MNEPLAKKDRVQLISMFNDPYPIKVGTRGTVTSVAKLGNETIYGVNWDDGRSLNLCDKNDEWEKL